MRTCEEMIRALQNDECREELEKLYVPDGSTKRREWAKQRAVRIVEEFQKRFSPGPDVGVALFSGPGRTELGGNHTDHQHGHVLCASVDLDMLACAAPNGQQVIRICSEGYPDVLVSLDQLEPVNEERHTSGALVRGVAAKMAEMGCSIVGFDACVTSDVLAGSGLSSSAAYEVLVAVILNHYGDGMLSPHQIAKAGQYAENVYFGKPCGLMDQMASAVGGVVAIDFADGEAPAVKKVPYDFSACGHALCIVDTGSCHADLTDDYAGILREMKSVAEYFGKQYLREVAEDAFYAALPELRGSCGDRAVLRAIHYYEDDRRAVKEAKALAAGDFEGFLALVNASGISSATNLQNIWSLSAPEEQAVAVALAIGKQLLENTGALRVHGGGFAGTVQAFVPVEKLDVFKSGMETFLGAGRCHVLHIRSAGGCLVIS